MNEHAIKVLGTTSATLTGGGGISTVIMSYFQSNSAGIGALCTVCTLFVYIVSQYLGNKKNNESISNRRKIDSHGNKLDSHIEETKTEFKKVGDGILSILNKLDDKDKH